MIVLTLQSSSYTEEISVIHPLHVKCKYTSFVIFVKPYVSKHQNEHTTCSFMRWT